MKTLQERREYILQAVAERRQQYPAYLEEFLKEVAEHPTGAIVGAGEHIIGLHHYHVLLGQVEHAFTSPQHEYEPEVVLDHFIDERVKGLVKEEPWIHRSTNMMDHPAKCAKASGTVRFIEAMRDLKRQYIAAKRVYDNAQKG